MVQNQVRLLPSYWATVSGGKDSLYMLKLILENPNIYPLDGVVHFELEIDYPFIKNVIDYMEKQCKQHGIPFVRIKPDKSYYDLYNMYEFPTHRRRWCNSQYKLNARKQLANYLKGIGYNLVCYIGLCADEVKRFKYEKYKEGYNKYWYPLNDFSIEEATILDWAKGQAIFNDFYKYNDRCGCMFCPIMSLKEGAYLKHYYPEEYSKLYKLASNTEARVSEKIGKPFSVWNGNAKYNTQYRDARIDAIIAEQWGGQNNG